ncbi:hypothetical protein TrVE_jg10614 [Triparma verrucosa]|uniref:Uncharacterized protein n=1 Tax=Triparma verrucosa TaxID=1606542 RepID=A0A9W7CA44_9STRA|nr:hypothetical protein TrVE_jg10614 [Triparma verrucosa]
MAFKISVPSKHLTLGRRHIRQRSTTETWVASTNTLDAPSSTTNIISNLVDRKFEYYPSLVPLQTLVTSSKLASQSFEEEGGHQGTYLNKPWKNSRIYIDGQKLWTAEDKTFMDPIINSVRSKLIELFGLPDKPTSLPVESAFVNYYVGSGDQPRDMERHVDCDWTGKPVPLSVVVQGLYENGDADGETFLGTLDCQTSSASPPVPVSLKAGDALILTEALHKPHPVPLAEKRLVFVVFLSALESVA